MRAGALVAFPTETVYGLGGLARSPEAVAAIYAAKGRPAHNPLIAHLADLAAAEAVARFDRRARALAEAFWPGPLTLVLPMRERAGLAPAATAGLPSVAVRVPAHRTALALLDAVGEPIAAPSANPSGRLSPTCADHVRANLGGKVALILDGGSCAYGLESAIVDLSDPGERPRLLRPGALARASLERALGEPLAEAPAEDADAAPMAPGALASHYAPVAELRLDASDPEPDEAYLSFGPPSSAPCLARRDLSPAGDPDEAARNLFAMLHGLDALAPKRIAVSPIPREGLGEAIADRLKRAAAPRPNH